MRCSVVKYPLKQSCPLQGDPRVPAVAGQEPSQAAADAAVVHRAGTQFNRKYFDMSSGLKTGLRLHSHSDRCLTRQFLNFSSV